ncbi:MAG: hypothetical protein M3219_01570 [Thermoproteota archaeon]|nr:hypothetical protein [Thermoproteota archaeon]
MQESGRSVRFSHIGISLAESETIYSILNGTFHVLEDDQEYLFRDQSMAGTVKFSFPFPFSDSFFELFADGWFELKHVLKDMKRRRGNKDLEVQFYFDGLIQDEGVVHFGLLFRLSNLNQKEFEMGLEKIEYHVDTITMELSKMPERGSQSIYSYNPFRRKWIR